jgi:uncharacterized protein YecE (DUF72 family)
MTELLIGTGGWAYFQIPGLKSLEAYSRIFNFVEVNSTFYRIPSVKLVKSWRNRVSNEFEFAVRCHKDVTHKYQMEPIEEAQKTFNTMTDICNILKARFLVLETPAEINFNAKKIDEARNFFESVDHKGIKLVWEVRQNRGESLPYDLLRLMGDQGIVQCVDLSKENPAVKSDMLYSRVFGKGQHNVYQFVDEELGEIDLKIAKSGSSRTAVSFHNVRMYKDAARFKIFKETGQFPSVTGTTGQQSLKKVLVEDTIFPSTKQELINKQGWKVIDLTKNQRVHASVLLEKLPDRRFGNIKEVIANLPLRLET